MDALDAWFVAFIDHVFARELALRPGEVARVRERLFTRFADPRTFTLYPGARELCQSVRARGLALGVISNWSERLPSLLAGLGLVPAVELVVCSALERVEKPEPEIFRRALARAGVEASQAVHAGNDLEKDGLGPLSVGILPVMVDHQGTLGDSRFERVSSLSGLWTWIERRIT